MAFLGLKVPHEIGRLLSSLDLPGEVEPSSSYHVTLFYLGENVPLETLAKAIPVICNVTLKTPPFTVETNEVTHFPAKPTGEIPIIARISSFPLMQLRQELKEAFEAQGIEYSKPFPKYQPHVTLTYLKDTPVPEPKSIHTVEWGVGEIVLWGGDSADDRLIVTFPFALTLDT